MSISRCSITHSAGINKIATMNIRFCLLAVAMCVFILGGFVNEAFGQPECEAWGNITGIRVGGELMEFESSLRVVQPGWMEITQTAKERQRPKFSRDGNKQIISTMLNGIAITEEVEDTGDGTATVNVEFTAQSDITMQGAYFCIELPAKDYAGLTTEYIGQIESTTEAPSAPPTRGFRRRSMPVSVTASGVRITSPTRQLEVTTDEPIQIFVQAGNPRRGGNANTQVYFTIISGNATADQTAGKSFMLKASGEIDDAPIHISIDASKPGQQFDGIGGNFRLQNPTTDPQVIDYCLENINVTWGRVEMPWGSWHPDEHVDPIAAAKAGLLNDDVHQAMLMAQKLHKKGMPVIVSAWFPPSWAALPPQPGVRGNILNPRRMDSIIRSLGAYIIYLKEAYGVEAVMFSFNESDIGIDVLQTDVEHADLIGKLGSYFASQGLTTKMLLGDTGDTNGYNFINVAMDTPEIHKYIGAVSFHSWRGTSDWVLTNWSNAARKMNIPLLVGEGSVDAAAHRYPAIFEENKYSLNEIDIYIRIAGLCQARSILQWQLTADYSVMSGGGIFGSNEPLRPTQRFWNLKQLGMTPKGSFHLPIIGDRPKVSSVALGDIANGVYSLHLVNNGATREVTLTGIPENVTEFRIYRTDHNRGMDEGRRVRVSDGTAEFTLDSVTYTTLISVQ